MILLAFDCGCRTGWAVIAGTRIESGYVDFNLARGESPGMRFLVFRAFLCKMLDTVKPDLVGYEQAHLRGGFATDLLVGFTTRIVEECAARRINCTPVHSATLKKASTGKGNADKAEMVKRACGIAGRKITDDNEADAICLAAYLQREFGQSERVEGRMS